MTKTVFKVVVIESVTERVWYEVMDIDSEEEAIAACLVGEGIETYRKHISTDRAEVEEVYQEEQNAVSMDTPRTAFRI